MPQAQSSDMLNFALEQKKRLIELARDPMLHEKLCDLSYDWESNVCNTSAEIFQILKDFGITEGTSQLNRHGRLLLGRLAIHFSEFDEGTQPTVGSYTISKRIRSGKNSVIFKAYHTLLQTPVILKMIRPGASDDIVSCLQKLSNGSFNGSLVLPNDLIRVPTKDVCGTETSVHCLVFPEEKGNDFSDFLTEKNSAFNALLALAFARQVGETLAELERIGAYHGDLHPHNIRVVHSKGGAISFKLLDVSFGAVGSTSLNEAKNDDLQNYKHLISRILSVQKSYNSQVSLRRFLGTRHFRTLKSILSSETKDFRTALHHLQDKSSHTNYVNAKNRFFSAKFSPPTSFRLQRYEEFTNPSAASELFVPFDELHKKISGFGNSFVSGNRGSGKSTYLASLAYFASVEKPVCDFRHVFGIYFACRQGELKGFTLLKAGDPAENNRTLVSILILKTMRRTLEQIVEAVAASKLRVATDLSDLSNFLNAIIPEPGIIKLETRFISELDNILSTLTRYEVSESGRVAGGQQCTGRILDVQDLIRFFGLVRTTFSELSTTRFYLLFDDAGVPYVLEQVQKAINELIITSNPIFCVKVTAERNTYSLSTTSGKELEHPHDYVEHDISATLFIGPRSTGSGLDHRRLEEYFRKIVNFRLREFGYQGHDILDYVGDPDGGSQILTNRLAAGHPNTSYFGWTTIWHLADRNPRNLLEIVAEIFNVAGIDRDTKPSWASMRDQNRAIKWISDKKLQALSQISGAIEVGGKRVSLGRKLFEVTIVIGATFHTYLRQDGRKLDSRKARQHLAIERNDIRGLSGSAELILQKLITYGVLDDSRIGVARDDQLSKPFYVLNRIYCPAFRIGYQRDDHLKLSVGKLELLLTQPEQFRKQGTKRLRDGISDGSAQIELFGYDIDALSEK